REFVESQEELGARIVGTFRDVGDPDRFVWVRSFPDVATRRAALAGFYGGPVWREHGPAANATMVDFSDVLLLEPVGPGFPTRHGPPSGPARRARRASWSWCGRVPASPRPPPTPSGCWGWRRWWPPPRRTPTTSRRCRCATSRRSSGSPPTPERRPGGRPTAESRQIRGGGRWRRRSCCWSWSPPPVQPCADRARGQPHPHAGAERDAEGVEDGEHEHPRHPERHDE